CSPGLAEQVEQVAGSARLHAGIRYQSGADPAWRHQVRADLSHGRLIHRDLPLPLDDLEMSVRCDDGTMTIDRLTAKAGPADVALRCQFQPPSGRPSPSASEDKAASLAFGHRPVQTPHPVTLI